MSQMNSKRLSSSDSPIVDRAELDAKILRLLNDPLCTNYELKEDGRIWIKSLNRFQSKSNSTSVQLWDNQDNLLETYPSMLNCSKSLGINRSTLEYRLQKNITFKYEGKLVYLKRG